MNYENLELVLFLPVLSVDKKLLFWVSIEIFKSHKFLKGRWLDCE